MAPANQRCSSCSPAFCRCRPACVNSATMSRPAIIPNTASRCCNRNGPCWRRGSTSRVLSGGEKSRLALVKLLLDPPNLLLMDEPTTHLDMPSIDALVGALKQFAGTVIFISHDVYFIRALANHVVHVNAGKLTHYTGGYQYYLDKTQAQSARAALTSPNVNAF